MEILHTLENTTKEEMENIEKDYILNNTCINSKVPRRTAKELYQKNKIDNPNYLKELYEKSEGKMRNVRTRMICECGGVYVQRNKLRHLATDKHLNYIIEKIIIIYKNILCIVKMKVKIGNVRYDYQKSTRKGKKLMVTVNDKTIHFGDSSMQHYKDKTGIWKGLDHKDKNRRDNYRKRAGGIKDKEGNLTYLNPMSANFHSYHILW